MSIHRSLKTNSALERHRNVLSRSERLQILKDQEKWEEGKSVFGLPKVAHRKASVGGKEKKVAKEGDAAAAPGAAGAPAAAPAAAAPAKGGKDKGGKDKK